MINLLISLTLWIIISILIFRYIVYITIDLVRYKEGDRTFIKPKHKRHIALFKHCTGGMTAVAPEFFNTGVKKLLVMHRGKWCLFNIKEEKK